MESVDIIEIWKEGNTAEMETPRYSLEQIQAYRRQSSDQSKRSGRLTILFDIGYKMVVALAFLFILTLPVPSVFKWVSGSLLCSILALTGWQLAFIRQLKAIKQTDSVLDNIKNQLGFLMNPYRKFVFTAAASNPMFVLAGFMLYGYYKHGSDGLNGFFADPIMYGFVVLAYAFSLAAQWPMYQKHVQEVKQLMESLDDDFTASINLREQRAKRMKRNILFAILFFIGLMVTLILLL